MKETRIYPVPQEIKDWFSAKKQQICPDFTSPPTYLFKAGDEVRYGAFDRVIVTDALFDGQVYVLECSGVHKGTQHDGPYCYERIVFWNQIRPVPTNAVSILQNYDIRIQHYNKSVDGVLSEIYAWGIDFNPSYQRGHVWKRVEKQALLSSIFRNIEIGKIAVVKRPYTPDHTIPNKEVVDGKQRLTTLLEFYENRLATEEGLYFNDLHWRDQIHFLHFPVAYAEMDSSTTSEQILRYFVNINRGRVMSKSVLAKAEEALNSLTTT